ncbi:hypothetical protein SB766_19590 [Pseudomonas sp. SIMBA_077]
MTMNSTLFLLNVLAMAILVGFHFQSGPVVAGQGIDVAGTYSKPLKPQPQRAVMTDTNSVTPHLAAERSATPAITDTNQGDRWVF